MLQTPTPVTVSLPLDLQKVPGYRCVPKNTGRWVLDFQAFWHILHGCRVWMCPAEAGSEQLTIRVVHLGVARKLLTPQEVGEAEELVVAIELVDLRARDAAHVGVVALAGEAEPCLSLEVHGRVIGGGAEEVHVDQLVEGLRGRNVWRRLAAGGDACASEQLAFGGRTPHARHSPRHSLPPCCAPVFASRYPWCEKAPAKRCLVGTMVIRRNDPYMEAIADP